MSMPPIPWRPARKTLVEFSEAALFVVGMVMTPLALLRGQFRLAGVLWGVAVAARVVGLWRPALLRPIFVGMMVVSWPIGWVVSNLVLGYVYYGMVTPVGLALRWRGRDLMGRTFDREATSYWQPVEPRGGADRHFRPF